MSKHTLLLPLLFAAVASTACADDDEVDGDVSAGWRATSKALAEQQLTWDAQTDAGGHLVAEGSCSDGGTASVEGTFDGQDAYDVTLSFNGCRSEGVTIDGTLSLHTEIVVTEVSAEVTSSFHGSLEWSGAAVGECSVDMELSVAASSNGNAAVSVEGEVCGYDAHAVVTASADE